MEKSQTIKEIATSLSNAQGDFPEIKKSATARIPTDKGGEFSYQYAKLDDVIAAIRPILKANGLSFTQGVSTTPEGVSITTMLLHTSGEWFETTMELKADTSGKKNALQALGSSVTYARRYCLEGILGIATTGDDDGRSGGSNGSRNSSHGTRPSGQQNKRQPNGDVIMTAIQVPGEFWKVWKTDRAAAVKILGGDGYGYKKNETDKKWYITKGDGMPDPKPQIPGNDKPADPGPRVDKTDPTRPSPDLRDPGANNANWKKPTKASLDRYNEIMVMCYKAKTREDADMIQAATKDAADNDMLDAEQGERIEKTLKMILKARNERS